MREGDEAVERERWQPIVLRWSTWAGITGTELRLTALP